MGDGKTTEEGQGRVAQAAAALNGQSKEKATLGFSKRGPIPFLVKPALIGSMPRYCGGTTAAAFQGRRADDDVCENPPATRLCYHDIGALVGRKHGTSRLGCTRHLSEAGRRKKLLDSRAVPKSSAQSTAVLAMEGVVPKATEDGSSVGIH